MSNPTPWPPARLSDIRRAFPVLQQVNYLNTGTYGPMPEPALQIYLEATARLERDGAACVYPFSEDAETVRAMLADLIGADANEIAFTRNATDGINLVLAGLEWREGDEVATTDQEHEAMLHPLLHLQKRSGIRLRFVAASPDPAEMLRALDATASPRLRLLAFSHVTCETGTRLPARDMCEWARGRRVRTLLDTAQSLGVLPVDIRSMECDFLTGNGHKWLHGPKGTGLFYARRDLMERLRPAHVGAGSMETADARDGKADPWSSGQRFEFGTRAWSLMTGWKESLRWMQNLGSDNVRSHIASFAGYAVRRLKTVRGVAVATPMESEGRAGLISFACSGKDAGEVGRLLREDGAVVSRHVPQRNLTRVSVAHFTSEQDIDDLYQAVERIARQ